MLVLVFINLLGKCDGYYNLDENNEIKQITLKNKIFLRQFVFLQKRIKVFILSKKGQM